MCINADIETQFEFLQQTWLLGQSFESLNDETDPLLGHHDKTILTRSCPLRLKGLPNFVTVRGDGYFFMPSTSALKLLQAPAVEVAAASTCPAKSGPNEPKSELVADAPAAVPEF